MEDIMSTDQTFKEAFAIPIIKKIYYVKTTNPKEIVRVAEIGKDGVSEISMGANNCYLLIDGVSSSISKANVLKCFKT